VDILRKSMFLDVRILDIHNSELYLECNIDDIFRPARIYMTRELQLTKMSQDQTQKSQGSSEAVIRNLWK